MSITKKIIFLNTILTIILVVLAIVIMGHSSQTANKEDLKGILTSRVLESVDALTDESGNVFADDDFKYYEGGVYISIYHESGSFIQGIFPQNFNSNLKLQDKAFQTYQNDGETYYTYDYYLIIPGRENLYLRGIIHKADSLDSMLTKSSLILIPICVVIAIGSSIIISIGSMRPLKEISKKANEITKSSDLKQRINLNSNDPSIQNVQNSMNQMMERLDILFSKEQRFSSDISHELRTPLSVMTSEIEYALEVKEDEDKDESLRLISKQIQRMTKLITDLLEFSRIYDTSSLSLEPICISDLCMEEVQSIETKKNIVVENEIDPGLFILGTEVLFFRMLSNLVDNGIKYGKENGHLYITLSSVDNKVVLKVKDDGIGIQEKDITHIFERMYMADTSRHNTQSFGLGLSFVSEIARLFHAKVEVESKVEEGSCFTIIFPKYQVKK